MGAKKRAPFDQRLLESLSSSSRSSASLLLWGGLCEMVSAEGLSVSPAPAKQYGVTKPISLAGPTLADVQRSAELEKVDFFIGSAVVLLFSGFSFFKGFMS